MSSLRIGIAFFYHESHTFSPSMTNLNDFINEGFHKGDEIIEAYAGTKTEVGGFIDILRDKDAEIIPLVCAAAIPSGQVTKDAYETIKEEMISALRQSEKLDGLLIALHGAMVVEHLSDPETEMLKKIRSVIGYDIPIATTLDMHANLSSEMISYTPLHFGFKTYPHVDMYEQGCKAAETLWSGIITSEKYVASFIKLPIMLPSINMRTAEGPMHDLVELAKQKEEDSDIIGATVFGGFPYSDIPEAGVSILVTGTDPTKTERTSKELAEKVWEFKDRFIVHLPSIDDAVKEALSYNGDKPIVLADISDNPLSGGTGDTTGLLKKMLEADIKNVLFGAFYDEESLSRCMYSGEGATVQLELGGKESPEFGEPLSVQADIIRLTEGKFRNKGPMNTGVLVQTNGAAHIRVKGMDILLTGRALSANDPELFRHIGIEPTEKNVLGMKVKNHFRSSFEDLVGKILYVDAPGLASNDLSVFNYKHIPVPIWPLNRTVPYQFELTTK
ncbi:M81 family metallopeptidase [Salipaludibacillus daqingensis]|uniref:M81 family metallopeptidase n=1 Tax=Salipaludibacillus daqingensis TaxID=3041001 RepID=UPI0024746C43|nr:M81 family metallopeptidase [Salipaludibacillus daqingensis]